MSLISTVGFAVAAFAVGVIAGWELRARRAPGSGRREGRERDRGREPRRPSPRREEDAAAGGAGEGEGIEIYVGNLGYDVADKDLNGLFRPFGKILSARVIRNRSNGKSKGYGFVNMIERPEAEAAIKALHGQESAGRKLVVNEARSRSRED
jgi:RNA recognition motif-containing protein